jgi:hypothetical protein
MAFLLINFSALYNSDCLNVTLLCDCLKDDSSKFATQWKMLALLDNNGPPSTIVQKDYLLHQVNFEKFSVQVQC